MVALSLRQTLGLPPVATWAGGAGLAAGAIAALVPTGKLETFAVNSGLASVLLAAQPPLGLTAKLAFIFFVAVATALAAFATGSAIVSLRHSRPARHKPIRQRDSAEGLPSVRRGDSHPDAPPRPPVLATRDLGVPFLDVKARTDRLPKFIERAKANEADLPPDLKPLKLSAKPSIDRAEPVAPVMAPAPPRPEPIEYMFDAAPPVAAEPEVLAAPAAEPVAEIVQSPLAANPIFAEDLALPVDLETPLAAFDPGAFAASLAAAPRRDRPARFETFELTPQRPVEPAIAPEPLPEEIAPRSLAPAMLARPVAQSLPTERTRPIAAPATEATIHALLDRLERGVALRGIPLTDEARRPANPAARRLDETLGELRRMATSR